MMLMGVKMPSIKRRLCPKHGIYTTDRCELCKKQSTKQYNSNRDKENGKIYHNVKWRKTRALQLSKYPLCINFNDCYNVATIADHIKEVSDGGEHYSLDNLQSMCASCHNTKTNNERAKRNA